MATITTKDGTSIFYKDWGTGQPVVFSHGWPLTADDWDGQMMFFGQRGYRVYRARPARPRAFLPDLGWKRYGHLCRRSRDSN
jgi:pimeloyl-ACP methyl ester carboxylesterase